ncbi:hypothetical protein ES703_110431 [subsurface metagenome]
MRVYILPDEEDKFDDVRDLLSNLVRHVSRNPDPGKNKELVLPILFGYGEATIIRRGKKRV